MENGYGGAQTEHKARIWLPVSLSGPLAQQIWSTGGNTSLPCASGPTNESQEKTIMEALIHDLKSKLAIDLDESPATLRKMGSAAAVTLMATLPQDCDNLYFACNEEGSLAPAQ